MDIDITSNPLFITLPSGLTIPQAYLPSTLPSTTSNTSQSNAHFLPTDITLDDLRHANVFLNGCKRGIFSQWNEKQYPRHHNTISIPGWYNSANDLTTAWRQANSGRQIPFAQINYEGYRCGSSQVDLYRSSSYESSEPSNNGSTIYCDGCWQSLKMGPAIALIYRRREDKKQQDETNSLLIGQTNLIQLVDRQAISKIIISVRDAQSYFIEWGTGKTALASSRMPSFQTWLQSKNYHRQQDMSTSSVSIWLCSKNGAKLPF